MAELFNQQFISGCWKHSAAEYSHEHKQQTCHKMYCCSSRDIYVQNVAAERAATINKTATHFIADAGLHFLQSRARDNLWQIGMLSVLAAFNML